MIVALRPESNSPEFAAFAGECEYRTGHTLKCLDIVVEYGMGYIAVDAMVQDNPQLPLIPYTLYFAQGDGAADDLRMYETYGIEWLHHLFGATEFFTEAQKQ